MCSTFKVLAAAAVLKLVDEGKEHLDRMVAYGKEDILEYAPVAKEHLKEGRMTLANLFAAAERQHGRQSSVAGKSAVRRVSRIFCARLAMKPLDSIAWNRT
jgi:Beta-lactamase